MKAIIRLVLLALGSVSASAISAQADINLSWNSSLGQSWANVEGADFRLVSANTGLYFNPQKSINTGISMTYEHSDTVTNLFDHYSGVSLNADLVLDLPEAGNLVPFLLIRVPMVHRFNATGKITRFITNGTDKSDGSIEFPSHSGTVVSTNAPRVDQFGYALDGTERGVEVGTGGRLNLTNALSLTAILGCSWRYMTITRAKGTSYAMIGDAEYAYEQRHGLYAHGTNINEGFSVEVERHSRFLRAYSLSLGIDYKI